MIWQRIVDEILAVIATLFGGKKPIDKKTDDDREDARP